jgi:hypothetical protein
VDGLTVATLSDGETWRELAGVTPAVAGLAERGMAFEQLDQLALEHPAARHWLADGDGERRRPPGVRRLDLAVRPGAAQPVRN